jgi:RNA polymerase sigma-70 factor (ECF subfamily)
VNAIAATIGNQLLQKTGAGIRSARKARIVSPKKRSANARFTELVEPSQERVYRLALRITRNTEDAEDVQQETLLKVHRKLGQFEGRSRFTTWISRIAINEALMCLRKRRTGVHMPLEEAMPPAEETLARDEFHSPVEGPEAAYSRKELRDLLTRAIWNLRPAYRIVFLLRAAEQLSTTETAGILQISASAVKARMRRARSELRGYLKQARSIRLQGHSNGAANMPGFEGQLVHAGWLI